MVRELLKERHFQGVLGAGYVLRYERISSNEAGGEPPFYMTSAFTEGGHYIGTSRWAYRLTRRGIIPELADPSHHACSIGFCVQDLKWYGWSHRALCGFGVGSVAEEGDCCTTSGWTEEYLEQHPEERDKVIPVGFEARNLSEARRMAIAFAESVS